MSETADHQQIRSDLRGDSRQQHRCGLWLASDDLDPCVNTVPSELMCEYSTPLSSSEVTPANSTAQE